MAHRATSSSTIVRRCALALSGATTIRAISTVRFITRSCGALEAHIAPEPPRPRLRRDQQVAQCHTALPTVRRGATTSTDCGAPHYGLLALSCTTPDR